MCAGPFAQKLRIGSSKSTLCFGFGNWVASNPKRNHGSGWIADDVGMKNGIINMCSELCPFFSFIFIAHCFVLHRESELHIFYTHRYVQHILGAYELFPGCQYYLELVENCVSLNFQNPFYVIGKHETSKAGITCINKLQAASHRCLQIDIGRPNP